MPTQQRINLNTQLSNLIVPVVDIPDHLASYQVMLDYVDSEMSAVNTVAGQWSLDKADYYTKAQVNVLLSNVSGGGGGASSLQAVTDIGNTTTNSITSSANIQGANLFGTSSIGVGLSASSNQGKFVNTALTSNRVYTLPNATGTMALQEWVTAGFSAAGHTHNFSDLNNKPTTLAGYGISDAFTQAMADGLYKPLTWFPAWSEVTGKPVFATVATSGSYSDLINKPTLFDGAYGSLTGVPTTFTPSVHSHDDRYYTEAEVDTLLATKQAAGSYVPTSRTITINGVTLDLTQDRSWTIAAPGGGGENPLTFNLPLSRSGDTISLQYQHSLEYSTGGLKLKGDVANISGQKFYGTDGAGARGWYSFPTTDWANIQNKPTTVTGYGITDGYTSTEVDTIAAAKVDKTTTITINGVTQDLSTNRSWTVTGSTGGGGITEVDSFIVDEPGELVAGATTYTNALLTGKTARQLMVFVDGLKLFPGRTDRFSFTLSGDTITFTAGLAASTSVEVFFSDDVTGTTPPTGDTLLINSTDNLLINNTDYLNL